VGDFSGIEKGPFSIIVDNVDGLTLMRVFMPLRGRATARNCSALPGCPRSHIGSCSLEGPPVSRDTQPLEADCFAFSRFIYSGAIASGRVSRLDFCIPAQTARGCAKPFLRLARRQGDACKETRASSAAEKHFCTLIPSYAIRRLNGDRSPVSFRLGGGAAHVEPWATIVVSLLGAGASVQSTRKGSGYQAYVRFGVH